MADAPPRRRKARNLPLPDQVALVLQGGGALGSYQAGVIEGLAASGIELDWVAGISIGAINAAIVAGNPPERRVERLKTFWDKVTSSLPSFPIFPDDTMLSNAYTMRALSEQEEQRFQRQFAQVAGA